METPLIRNRDPQDSPATSRGSSIQTYDHLDENDREQFERDGYVFINDLFSREEVAAMLQAIRGDQTENELVCTDTRGKKSRLALWHRLGNDIWAAASICPRVVHNARFLLRDEVAFFHGKVMLK